MRREFLGGVKDNDREVVERLVEENKESALKTKPKVSEKHEIRCQIRPLKQTRQAYDRTYEIFRATTW
jgi:hypothetical protein